MRKEQGKNSRNFFPKLEVRVENLSEFQKKNFGFFPKGGKKGGPGPEKKNSWEGLLGWSTKYFYVHLRVQTWTCLNLKTPTKEKCGEKIWEVKV